MFTERLHLVPAPDGSYDLVIQYDRLDAEFALDFLSKDRIAKRQRTLSAFLLKNAKGIRISAVRFMVAGLVVASIPFSAFVLARAAEPEALYSMANTTWTA